MWPPVYRGDQKTIQIKNVTPGLDKIYSYSYSWVFKYIFKSICNRILLWKMQSIHIQICSKIYSYSWILLRILLKFFILFEGFILYTCTCNTFCDNFTVTFGKWCFWHLIGNGLYYLESNHLTWMLHANIDCKFDVYLCCISVFLHWLLISEYK